MTKTYYKNEYTEKQWRALIDTATEMSCKVIYNKYGDRAEIDSTELENILCKDFPESNSKARQIWSEYIHNKIHGSTDLRTWKVQPKRYRKGYCSTIYKNQRAAEYERERLEMITGFEWKVTLIPE